MKRDSVFRQGWRCRGVIGPNPALRRVSQGLKTSRKSRRCSAPPGFMPGERWFRVTCVQHVKPSLRRHEADGGGLSTGFTDSFQAVALPTQGREGPDGLGRSRRLAVRTPIFEPLTPMAWEG